VEDTAAEKEEPTAEGRPQKEIPQEEAVPGVSAAKNQDTPLAVSRSRRHAGRPQKYNSQEEAEAACAASLTKKQKQKAAAAKAAATKKAKLAAKIAAGKAASSKRSAEKKRKAQEGDSVDSHSADNATKKKGKAGKRGKIKKGNQFVNSKSNTHGGKPLPVTRKNPPRAAAAGGGGGGGGGSDGSDDDWNSTGSGMNGGNDSDWDYDFERHGNPLVPRVELQPSVLIAFDMLQPHGLQLTQDVAEELTSQCKQTFNLGLKASMLHTRYSFQELSKSGVLTMLQVRKACGNATLKSHMKVKHVANITEFRENLIELGLPETDATWDTCNKIWQYYYIGGVVSKLKHVALFYVLFPMNLPVLFPFINFSSWHTTTLIQL
jgi:flagellar biosynthesis GTPase FlhF